MSDRLTLGQKLTIKPTIDGLVMRNYEKRNSLFANASYTAKNGLQPGAMQDDDEDTYEISAVLEFMQSLVDPLVQKIDELSANLQSTTASMEVDPDPRDDEFRLRLTLPHGVGSTRRNVPGMFFGNR